MNDGAQLNILAIITHRVEVEHQLTALLRKYKSEATLEKIQDFVFNEDPDRARFSDYVRVMLDRIGAPVDDTLPLIQDAWNYFPHRRLGGRCPAELFFAPRD